VRLSAFLIPSLMLSIGLAACSGHDLRPGFRNTQEVLRRSWTYAVEPLSSSRHLGGLEYASPLLFENSLVFGSMRSGLVSLYPAIKRVRWKFDVPNGIVSQVETQKDSAFFTGGDGILYSLSLDHGKVLWTYELRNPVTSRPRVSGDDLFVVTSDDALLCLEAKTGKWQWHYRRRNTSGPGIHGASQPLILGDRVWVGFADGALVALSRKDGKVLWEKQLNTNRRFSGLNAEFLENDGVVYVPAYDQALYALNASNGNLIWARDGLGGSKKVSFSRGVLYVPSSQGYLHALDAKTGKDLWKFELDHGVPSDVLVTDRHVIFASTHEYLYALDRSSGELVYRYQVGYDSGFSGGLAFDRSRNQLFVLSRGGNLYAFQYSE
jgi:outer membrane protein assembly factor BamB